MGDWCRICGEFAGVTSTDRVDVDVAVAGGLLWQVARKNTHTKAAMVVSQRE
jgi:hypothetical protein